MREGIRCRWHGTFDWVLGFSDKLFRGCDKLSFTWLVCVDVFSPGSGNVVAVLSIDGLLGG